MRRRCGGSGGAGRQGRPAAELVRPGPSAGPPPVPAGPIRYALARSFSPQLGPFRLASLWVTHRARPGRDAGVARHGVVESTKWDGWTPPPSPPSSAAIATSFDCLCSLADAALACWPQRPTRNPSPPKIYDDSLVFPVLGDPLPPPANIPSKTLF